NLYRLMGGAAQPDAGMLTVGGRPVSGLDPHLARSLGIAVIYQQPALFPDLTVAENIALGLERGSLWRRVDWRARRQAATDTLARVGAAIDPDRAAGSLSMPEQPM